MSRRNIRAGRAEITIGVNKNPALKALRDVQVRLRNAAKNITAIGATAGAAGATILGPLAAVTKSFASMGDELDKMASRTGVSVEALSELAFAAEQSGSSLPTVEKGIKRMQSVLLDAQQGVSTATDALSGLGLSISELQTLSPEQQFQSIAAAIGDIEDPSERAARSMEVFGRAGQELLPLITSDIKSLRSEARKLGRQMSTQDATAAAMLTDAMNRVASIFKGITKQVGAALAPAFTVVADKMSEVGIYFVEFVQRNRTAIQVIAGVGAALIAAGTALTTLGGVAAVASIAVGGISTAITTVGAVAGAVLSPIGITLGAVAAAAGVVGGTLLVVAAKTGILGDAWEGLKSIAMSLADTARQAFGGIRDALMAGDLATASQIAWATLKKVFFGGIETIVGAVKQMMVRIVQAAANAYTQWIGITVNAAKSVAKAIKDPFNASAIIGNFAGDMAQALGSIQSDGVEKWARDQRIAAAKELDRLVAKAAAMRKALSDAPEGDTDPKGIAKTAGELKATSERIAKLKDEIAGLNNLAPPGVDSPEIDITGTSPTSTTTSGPSIARFGSQEAFASLRRVRPPRGLQLNQAAINRTIGASAGIDTPKAASDAIDLTKLEGLNTDQLAALVDMSTKLSAIVTNTKHDEEVGI